MILPSQSGDDNLPNREDGKRVKIYDCIIKKKNLPELLTPSPSRETNFS